MRNTNLQLSHDSEAHRVRGTLPEWGGECASVLLPCSSSARERVAGTRLGTNSEDNDAVWDCEGLSLPTIGAGSRGEAAEVGSESRVGFEWVGDSMVARYCSGQGDELHHSLDTSQKVYKTATLVEPTVQGNYKGQVQVYIQGFQG